jgi:hypothetical protein
MGGVAHRGGPRTAVLGYAAPWLYQVIVLGEGPAGLLARHADMLRYQASVGADLFSLWDRLTGPLVWLFNPLMVFSTKADARVWLLVVSNPLVFWPGIGALGWLAFRYRRSPRSPEVFLVLAALSFYLPWFAIARFKYSYYLLPVVPLLAIALARVLEPMLTQEAASPAGKRRRLLLIGYLAMTAAVFIGLYPAATGVWEK